MNTETSFDKGLYQAPLCMVIALNSDSCVLQTSIGGPSTETFDTPDEDELWS